MTADGEVTKTLLLSYRHLMVACHPHHPKVLKDYLLKVRQKERSLRYRNRVPLVARILQRKNGMLDPFVGTLNPRLCKPRESGFWCVIGSPRAYMTRGSCNSSDSPKRSWPVFVSSDLYFSKPILIKAHNAQFSVDASTSNMLQRCRILRM
jgi:hypothetical protein